MANEFLVKHGLISNGDISFGANTVSGTGDVFCNNLSADGLVDATTLDSLDSTQFIRSDVNDNISADISWGNSNKAIFGAGDDLQIYHNGSHSYIDNITGNLYLRPKAGEDGLVISPDGSVDIYYDNSKKFETTTDGIQVNGTSYLNGTTSIIGDLTVSGTTFITQHETVEITDNLLLINNGEVGAGVTASGNIAGIEVYRGSLTNYRFVFDETQDNFRIGEIGDLQAVASREDTPTTSGVPFWNNTASRLDTDNLFKYTSGTLYSDKAVFDEIIAKDSGGISLKDDSETLGVFVEDGGQVGIGTATPSEALDVSGFLMLSSSANQYIKGDTKDVNDNNAFYIQGAGTNLSSVISIGTGATSRGRVISMYGGSWTSNRVEIYHDGNQGVINTGAGNLVLDPTNNIYIGDGKFLAADEIRARDSGGLSLTDDSGTHGVFVENGGQVGIGTNNPESSLEVFGGNLSSVSGTVANLTEFGVYDNNNSRIIVRAKRSATGSDWNTDDLYLQKKVDETDQAYLKFTGYGLALGTGGGNNPSDRLTIDSDGNITQADSLYFATDEIRARDSGGLSLKDDSGTSSILIADGGEVYLYANLQLGDEYIQLKPVPGTGNTGNGLMSSVTVDTNSTGVGAVLYLNTDEHYDEADASSSTTADRKLVIALESGTGTKKVLDLGYFRGNGWSLTVGAPIYLSTTTGAITSTAPSGSGDQVVKLGYAVQSDIIYFNPNSMVVEVS
jgi:hypothetical protein